MVVSCISAGLIRFPAPAAKLTDKVGSQRLALCLHGHYGDVRYRSGTEALPEVPEMEEPEELRGLSQEWAAGDFPRVKP
jgi:hypothetical protein